MIIGVLLDTAFLKFIEFLAGLTVEVFPINYEKTFLDIGIVLKKCRSFERSEGFTATGCVPDIAVAIVVVNAIYNGLDRIDLVWAHHK